MYRPANKAELDLIQMSGWLRFPPRLPEQPIFYPVTNQSYASQITTDWNIPAYNNGFVLEFKLSTSYLSKYKIEKVGLDHHTELWIPSEEMEEFNNQIIGKIKVIESYHSTPANEYVMVRDIFSIRDKNMIAFKFINNNADFTITENSTIGDFRIKKYMPLIRKIADEDHTDRGFFVVTLRDKFNISPIAKDNVYLLVSDVNKWYI